MHTATDMTFLLFAALPSVFEHPHMGADSASTEARMDLDCDQELPAHHANPPTSSGARGVTHGTALTNAAASSAPAGAVRARARGQASLRQATPRFHYHG
jgi:hypothetical protein